LPGSDFNRRDAEAQRLAKWNIREASGGTPDATGGTNAFLKMSKNKRETARGYVRPNTINF
jgi:hypothetical protein